MNTFEVWYSGEKQFYVVLKIRYGILLYSQKQTNKQTNKHFSSFPSLVQAVEGKQNILHAECNTRPKSRNIFFFSNLQSCVQVEELPHHFHKLEQLYLKVAFY